ncbi:glycogen debranching enzyme, partial [Morone saxatilis]|uniref:glycogen debranching enzyme n=1 Tax=Morone saxatilis TaxID=34816 RepID=UPI0015E20B8A
MERLEKALFRLEQGFELQFRLGPTLQGKEVQVYTNYPAKGHKFDRLKFCPLDWVYPNGREDDSDKYCRLDLTVAGSFQYYFSCGDTEKVSSGYIVVDPVLRVGGNNDVLLLDCISSQTYLAKCLGPLDKWLDRIRVAKETGYNMIHFTPLQKLGLSGFCYSIADQLELNPDFSPEGKHCTWRDIGNLLETLRKDWNMVCITDVVYNHTAADSEWIHLHPECGYNLVNSPYLKPAWLLDRLLWHLNCEVANGKYAEQGVPACIQDEHHINALQGLLWQQVFSRLRLWEFLQVNVDDAVEQFKQLLQEGSSGVRSRSSPECKKQLKIVQDLQHRRFGNKVDMNSALNIFTPHSMSPSDIQECCNSFRGRLEELNLEAYKEMNHHAEQATDCIVRNVVHERLSDQGPKLGPVSRKYPLCPRYFIFPFEEMTFDEETQLMEQRDKACHFLAHDGFVKGNDLSRDFVGPGSQVYLRRELVCLGNTIKLRYGEKPEDCPYLWARMKSYTEITAKVFSGVCLVNCLSTPLHVAEAMLAAARDIRPNLYVIAELFTGSQFIDNVWLNRLGITSLVRAHARSGSLSEARPTTNRSDVNAGSGMCTFKSVEPPNNTENIISVFSLSFFCCHFVVDVQVDLEQLDEDVVAVTRHCPSSHQSVVAVLRRAVKNPETHHFTFDVPPMFIPGQIKEVVLEALTIVSTSSNKNGDKNINGLPERTVEIKEHIKLKDSRVVKKANMVSKENSVVQEIVFEKFPPGCIIIFRVTLDPSSQEQLGALRRQLIQFSPQYQTCSLAELRTPSVLTKPLMIIMSRLTLADMNMLLYRCDAEEREDGGGCYNVPAWLPLNYGGLQGLMSVMAEIRPKNDLGHPLCDNLRQGDWMMDYVSNRLLAKGGTVGEVGHWFQAMFGYLKHIPR